MKHLKTVHLLLGAVICLAFSAGEPVWLTKGLQTARFQLAAQSKNGTDTNQFPRTTKADGSVRYTPSWEWTSGFFSGSLWQLYELTGEPSWANEAKRWMAGMEKEKMNKGTHDLGFMIYNSFGQAYRLAGDEQYKAITLQAARTLTSRFNPKVGCIKSWDHGKWRFPVIIDNLMNLELLFWATKMTGDSSFYQIAVTHANTTIQNHIRPDNSSFHVVNYDPETGQVIEKKTAQGFADNSTWSRGHAWGIYGFTMLYRETGDLRYLDQAAKMADFWLQHPNLPKDGIPYWDFNSTDIPNTVRDAAAGAIFCSAMFELSTYPTPNRKLYRKTAINMLKTLSSDAYLATPGTNGNFLLKHCTGAKPMNSEVDVPLVYADYYYLEAIRRFKQK